MKLRFIFLGKKNSSFLDVMMTDYMIRLNKYAQSECVFIDEKNEHKLEQRLLKKVKPRDCLIILDEKGKSLNTPEYSKFIYNKITNHASVIFLVGDAYGVPDNIMNKATAVIALSKMTFPHMVARLMLLEQTYRVFCILNNHPYHHE